jgi:hypothetical protein
MPSHQTCGAKRRCKQSPLPRAHGISGLAGQMVHRFPLENSRLKRAVRSFLTRRTDWRASRRGNGASPGITARVVAKQPKLVLFIRIGTAEEALEKI